jgi:2Fe-2S ferredoxin
MARITYIEFNGTAHSVDVPPGQSVMEGAVRNGVPGIDADCGGNCACATCHVFVDEAWLDKVGAPLDGEKAMLEYVQGALANSRLSCQIAVTAALDGLVVRTPEHQ